MSARGIRFERFTRNPATPAVPLVDLRLGVTAKNVGPAVLRRIAEALRSQAGGDGIRVRRFGGPSRNPSLVHHGFAQGATFHLLSTHGAPFADLYFGNLTTAKRVAQVIANHYGAPLVLAPNDEGGRTGMISAAESRRRSPLDQPGGFLEAITPGERSNPRVKRHGSGYLVTMTRADVEAFKSRWPASGLPNKPITFAFAANGDLVDMGGLTEAEAEAADGSGALVALSQDAQASGRVSSVPKRLKWNMYAGGTGAWEGAHSYDARTPWGQYTVDPITTQYGRRAGYVVRFNVGGPGLLPLPAHMHQPGLYRDLGRERSPNAAKRIAQAHHEAVIAGEVQPNPATPIAGQVWTGLVDGKRDKIVSVAGSRVLVLHTESGNREWMDAREFTATHRPVTTRRNPARGKGAKAGRQAKRRAYGSRRILRAAEDLSRAKKSGQDPRSLLARFAYRHDSRRGRLRARAGRENPYEYHYETGDRIQLVMDASTGGHELKKGWIGTLTLAPNYGPTVFATFDNLPHVAPLAIGRRWIMPHREPGHLYGDGSNRKRDWRQPRRRRNPQLDPCACGAFNVPTRGVWSAEGGYEGFHSVAKCWTPELTRQPGVAGYLVLAGAKPRTTRTAPAWTKKPLGDLDEVKRNPRELSVPERHQLKIARDTLKMSEPMARVMGGPSHAEAREIIYRLTGKRPPQPNPAAAVFFDRRSLPELGRKLAAAAFPEYSGNKFSLAYADQLHVNNTWSGGSKEDTVFVRLDTLEVFRPPDTYHTGAQTTPIPDGVVAVQHAIFMGKDQGVRFVVPRSAARLLEPPASNESEDELIVLDATRSLKSSYGGIPNFRFSEARRLTGITLERWEAAKAALIARGLLNKAGAITAAGRNAVGQFRMDRIRRPNPRGARAAYFNRFMLELPASAVSDMSGPGPADTAVAHWAPKISRPAQVTPEALAAELREYGAWEDDELSDDAANWERILWIAANNIREDDAQENPRPFSDELERARDTFHMWHEFDTDKLERVKVPSRKIPRHLVNLGEVVRIDYKSNKWEGRPVTYTHSTKRPRPKLVTDPDARQLFIVGGKMRPTADGLIN